MALAAPPGRSIAIARRSPTASRRSDRVLVMLNTLMDISEAESGAMPLQPRAGRARRRRRRARSICIATSPRRKASRSTAARRRPTSWSSADRTRLEQVAANLIDNAVKYTPAGGRVDVEVRRDDGRARALRCATPAPAFPRDELPRIWDRLFRGDTSRTERGLGLGLSLVKADRRGARRNGRGRRASPARARRSRSACPSR